jgi:hypothetical protein
MHLVIQHVGAMGSPLSGTLAEIFLQELEQSKLKYLLEGKRIIYYNRYVDDIFIIYDQSKITPQHILEQFNAQHKDLQFTINEEINNQIEYLDLKLTNIQGQLEIGVYRKPTTTDVTINSNSCHPREHKMAAYKSWLNRLCKLPLSANSNKKELDIIISIATNNGYKKEDIIKLYDRIKTQQNKNPEKTEKTKINQKWVTFTYTGNYIRKITNLDFLNQSPIYNIKLAYSEPF